MEFKEILRGIIFKNFDILKRRDEFLEVLKTNAAPRDFNTLKRIERAVNILERLFAAKDESAERKLELKENLRKAILDNVEVIEERTDFILDSFFYALNWDLKPISIQENKNIVKEKLKVAVNNTNSNTWTCVCGNVNNGKFCSECGKQYEKILKQKIFDLLLLKVQKMSISNIWTCVCGNINNGKFCTECGKLRTTATPAPSTNIFLQVSVDDLIKEYNNLFNKKFSVFTSICENFEKKYSVIGISYISKFKKLNNSNIPPVCVTDSKTRFSHIWLIQIDDSRYIGFFNPNIRYTDGAHTSMKDIFKSNYKRGDYTKFKIITPAIFVPDGDFWKCEQQGEMLF